jgi:hypothetical protein
MSVTVGSPPRPTATRSTEAVDPIADLGRPNRDPTDPGPDTIRGQNRRRTPRRRRPAPTGAAPNRRPPPESRPSKALSFGRRRFARSTAIRRGVPIGVNAANSSHGLINCASSSVYGPANRRRCTRRRRRRCDRIVLRFNVCTCSFCCSSTDASFLFDCLFFSRLFCLFFSFPFQIRYFFSLWSN